MLTRIWRNRHCKSMLLGLQSGRIPQKGFGNVNTAMYAFNLSSNNPTYMNLL